MAKVKIIEDFITIGNRCRPGQKNKKSWIVIHETGNFSSNAGAERHSQYIKNLARQNNTYLSWHYTVDDKEIYHHIPDDEITWNAGDGRKVDGGNMSGISIEICVNSNFDVALENTASLVADLLLKHGLKIDAVKQHFDFSKKNCPQTIRNNGLWPQFIDLCKKYLIDISK